MDAARMTDNSVISIDFDAIAQNMAVLRGMVGPSCAVNAVVKADAYGLGAVRVARRLVQSGAAMLTVYSPAQAEQLEGLPVPVLVLQAVRTLVRGEAIHSMLVAGRLHLVVHDLHHVAEIYHNKYSIGLMKIAQPGGQCAQFVGKPMCGGGGNDHTIAGDVEKLAVLHQVLQELALLLGNGVVQKLIDLTEVHPTLRIEQPGQGSRIAMGRRSIREVTRVFVDA